MRRAKKDLLAGQHEKPDRRDVQVQSLAEEEPGLERQPVNSFVSLDTVSQCTYCHYVLLTTLLHKSTDLSGLESRQKN